MIYATVHLRQQNPRITLIWLVVQDAGNLLRLRPTSYSIFVFQILISVLHGSRLSNIGATLVAIIIRGITKVHMQVYLIYLWPSEVSHVIKMILQAFIASVLMLL